MTTTFEDNTEVTLTDLNEIAIDLGYTNFSAFSAEKFGVDELNQITADLVSSGVLRTGANGALGCEVIVSEGEAEVQTGVIVFESGAKIRITEPVGIELVAGTYIYAIYDATIGRASLEVSETAPEGDYVMLAQVDADSVIADRRSACVAKVTLSADTPNTYRTAAAVLEDVSDDYSNDVYVNNKITADMGTNAYSYIRFLGVRRYVNGEMYMWTPEEPLICLSEEGVRHSISVKVPGLNYVRFTRSSQYQEVEVSGGVGIKASGKYVINFMVM
ncbi:MAG: hypothetical protein IJ300_00800 [Clostridia bacterium]|nr:hypothetical protein [Clostridia bacterium]